MALRRSQCEDLVRRILKVKYEYRSSRFTLRSPSAGAADDEQLVFGAESIIAEPLVALIVFSDSSLRIFELDVIRVEGLNSEVCEDGHLASLLPIIVCQWRQDQEVQLPVSIAIGGSKSKTHVEGVVHAQLVDDDIWRS